jgi:hypothetical protein
MSLCEMAGFCYTAQGALLSKGISSMRRLLVIFAAAIVAFGSADGLSEDYRSGDKLIVRGTSAEIKAAPCDDSQTIEKVRRRTVITIENVEGDWISISEPRTGWMQARDLAVSPPLLAKFCGAIRLARAFMRIGREDYERATNDVSAPSMFFRMHPSFLRSAAGFGISVTITTAPSWI